MAGVLPFDDRDGFIWFDGKLLPWRDAKVHVLTHGLHYGSCVFEGERVYGGKVFKLTEHSERLVKSGEILGMKVPFSAAEIDAATTQVIKANNIVDGYVRPVAWRGSEMMGVAAQANRIHVAIAVWSRPSYWSPEARMRGIRLNISEWKRPHPETAPTASKAAGLYMICTMSKHKAEGDGFEDSLMMDWRGQVAEATGANVFFVFDGELHTPTPDCFLNGITRQTVIALAKQRGIKVVERAIFPEEMAKASECFLTGTAAEVTPVREIGPYTFTPGEVSRQLIADYEALVRE
ncbi:branched-chain amino acid aminotransferase [Magnetospirillum moscoviense]|uniref:Branched-chain-amino-acid aminotransferase n=1 Tax=Magnetospirillum moscoviense TaxID=1437059 RepID=A0A178MUL2_9PROT|nr:branched-chain amino acid aminotransferase [Magnetospirillum moscoviense]OAN53971.1 branched-chain amino acid aminotransferase [Magnetospirillum moscoviense]